MQGGKRRVCHHDDYGAYDGCQKSLSTIHEQRKIQAYLNHIRCRGEILDKVMIDAIARIPELSEPCLSHAIDLSEISAGIQLIVQYFSCGHEDRQKELDACLRRERENRHIGQGSILPDRGYA